MLFRGFESGAVVSTLLNRADQPITGWFQLAVQEDHLPPSVPSLKLLPPDTEDGKVPDEVLRRWLPNLPAVLGEHGRRLAYAFCAHALGDFDATIIETRSILRKKWALSRLDNTIVLLLKADAQLLLGDTIGVVQTLKEAYEASRHHSIAPEVRLQFWILISECLLLMDLPSLAEEVLEVNILTITVADGPDLQCAWGLLGFAKRHARRDLTVRSGIGCSPGELDAVRRIPVSGAIMLRMNRLAFIDPISDQARSLLQRLRETSAQPGNIVNYTEQFNKLVPLGVQRTLYSELSLLPEPGLALDVVAMHYLNNHILDTPDKRLAHILWMQPDDPNSSIEDNDLQAGSGEHDIIEMLDAATRQESMLRDDYAQLSRRIEALLAKSREIESLRADISAPIARIENDITKLIEYSSDRADGIEVRAQLQRTTEAIQRDIEDLLLRINRRTTRR